MLLEKNFYGLYPWILNNLGESFDTSPIRFDHLDTVSLKGKRLVRLFFSVFDNRFNGTSSHDALLNYHDSIAKNSQK